MENKHNQKPFEIPKKESLYKEYINSKKAVGISQGGDVTYGKYYNEDSEFLYLKPSYIARGLPFESEKNLQIPQIEENIPTLIRKKDITKVTPTIGNMLLIWRKNIIAFPEKKSLNVLERFHWFLLLENFLDC